MPLSQPTKWLSTTPARFKSNLTYLHSKMSCVMVVLVRFTILPRDFATETGELTSTLKLKRSVAEKKNMASIAALYLSKESMQKIFFFLRCNMSFYFLDFLCSLCCVCGNQRRINVYSSSMQSRPDCSVTRLLPSLSVNPAHELTKQLFF